MHLGIEIFTGTDGQHYWRMRARNGRITAIGGEGYASERNARRAAARHCDRIIAAYEALSAQ